MSEDHSHFKSRRCRLRNFDFVIIGAIEFDPTIMIGAIAAAIGGTVVFGSNMSTLKQTVTDLKAAEAHRTESISRMDLRVVGDGAGG
jgi:hypothetical protein